MSTPLDGRLTRVQALKLYKSRWWEGLEPAEIADAQLRQPLLCMDFGDFQAAVEKALGRPVWTHEFAKPDALIAELEGRKDPPTDPLTSLHEVTR